ncbi:MAG: thermonuclease family protein [Candidatus Daviesbacteria bacterium]|nr:thermonuclease family protein [Candidatus Daviesbacteria bacterium]
MNEEKSINLRFFAIALVLLIVGILLLFLGFNQGSSETVNKTETPQPSVSSTQSARISEEPIKGEEAEVTRVVDGDTIVISSGEKVRYIGIDTPETVDPRRAVGCFGKEASNENKKLVEGKTVVLMKDISDKDQFGRLLRLVYLKQDDGNFIFVNDYLVREGFAKASTYPPDVKFSKQFVEAEREAREASRGLWKMCL